VQAKPTLVVFVGGGSVVVGGGVVGGGGVGGSGAHAATPATAAKANPTAKIARILMIPLPVLELVQQLGL